MYNCLDLLPQSNDTLIQDSKIRCQVTKMIINILKMLIATIDTFYIQKKYQDFDAHVGDTACHIRMYKIILLALEEKSISEIQHRLQFFKKTLAVACQLYDNLAHSRHQNNRETIESYIKKTNLFFTITEKEYFLFQAFFLCKYKSPDQNNNFRIQYDLIVSEWSVSKSFSIDLAKYYQFVLSKINCSDVINWAQDAGWNIAEIEVLKSLQKNDHIGRSILPCYFSSKIVFSLIVKKKIAIKLILKKIYADIVIDEKIYFYSPNESTGKKLFSFNQPNHDITYIVIEGYYHVKNHLSDDGWPEYPHKYILELFLLNMAAHPQYTGKTLETHATNPFAQTKNKNITIQMLEKELLFTQEVAKREGCTQDNPYLFVATHVYLAGNSITIPNKIHELIILEAVA